MLYKHVTFYLSNVGAGGINVIKLFTKSILLQVIIHLGISLHTWSQLSLSWLNNDRLTRYLRSAIQVKIISGGPYRPSNTQELCSFLSLIMILDITLTIVIPDKLLVSHTNRSHASSHRWLLSYLRRYHTDTDQDHFRKAESLSSGSLQTSGVSESHQVGHMSCNSHTHMWAKLKTSTHFSTLSMQHNNTSRHSRWQHLPHHQTICTTHHSFMHQDMLTIQLTYNSHIQSSHLSRSKRKKNSRKAYQFDSFSVVADLISVARNDVVYRVLQRTFMTLNWLLH